MKGKICYFSSTGNSLYVSKKICENINECEAFSIVKMLKNKEFLIDEDIVGFVYPVHVGSVPIVVEEFLKKVNIKGNPYIFAIGVTGGSGANLSFRHINNILNNRLSSVYTIKYISNYIRAGRNATKYRAIEAIEKNEKDINSIVRSINNKEIMKIGNTLGIQFLMYKLWRDNFKNKDKKFNVNENCISCNICSDACPTNNIIMKNGKPTWNGRCTDCMACINLCPKNAINIGTKTINKERYINPKINIKELL